MYFQIVKDTIYHKLCKYRVVYNTMRLPGVIWEACIRYFHAVNMGMCKFQFIRISVVYTSYCCRDIL